MKIKKIIKFSFTFYLLLNYFNIFMDIICMFRFIVIPRYLQCLSTVKYRLVFLYFNMNINIVPRIHGRILLFINNFIYKKKKTWNVKLTTIIISNYIFFDQNIFLLHNISIIRFSATKISTRSPSSSATRSYTLFNRMILTITYYFIIIKIYNYH